MSTTLPPTYDRARLPTGRRALRKLLLCDGERRLVETDRSVQPPLGPADRGQRPQGPRPRRGEEPELTLRAGHHLGGELVGLVQQSHVGAGDRRPVVPDLTLDHRLAAQVDAGEGTTLLRGSAHVSSLLDRDADERAVLDPAAVVVLDVGLAEQLAQHEPGVARALADPAVGDGRLAVVEALLGVELLQLLVALECAVLVGRLAPRDVLRGRDVAALLRLLLRQGRGGGDLAGGLGGRAHDDDVLAADRGGDLATEGAVGRGGVPS